MNPRLKSLNDRELLELIVSNQVNLAQQLFRMNAFFIDFYGEQYANKIEHKELIFSQLFEEHQHLLQQIDAAARNEDF